MQEIIVPYLRCPECKGDIIISKIVEKKIIGEKEFLDKALLRCCNCKNLFPIIDGIPRLLKKKELTLMEMKWLKKLSEASGEIVVSKHKMLNKNDKLKLIEKRMRKLFKPEKAVSLSIRKRIEYDLKYRVYYSDKKEKHVETTKLHFKGDMHSILEVGGGQGGTTTCFRKYFNPQIAISIDIDLTMSKISQIRDPFINIIRADGTNIPIKDNCIDFVITTAVLEHIEAWKICLYEITRVSKNALISYAPNKWFGYDWCHVEGPIIPFLPKENLVPIIYLLHKLRRTGRDYQGIKKSISTLYYISRYSAVKELKKYGNVINVFADFMEYSIKSDYHYMGGKFIKSLFKNKIIKKIIITILLVFKIEPVVYLFFKKS